MKLNLDFALYKGTTRLRVWWKEVKAHFTAVQDAVNELDTDIADEAATRERVDGEIISNVTDAIAAIDLLNDDMTNLSDDVDNIANGSTPITPTLEAGTTYYLDSEKYGFATLRAMANALVQLKNAFVGDDTNEWEFKGDALYFGDGNGEIHINDGYAVHLKESDYSGFSSLAAIAAAIATLNGNDTVTGSVDKKVKDAINEFATAITAALPIYATAAEIREVWNPTPEPEPEPVTPTVTLTGDYDADSETLIVSAEDIAKLGAMNVQELFTLVIHATGVVYSGAAKKITTITTSLSDEAPTYEFRNSIPLWDSEYDYDTFLDCYIISHYDSPDVGEIGGGSW